MRPGTCTTGRLVELSARPEPGQLLPRHGIEWRAMDRPVAHVGPHDLFRRLWPKRAGSALHGLQARPIGLHRLPHAASHLGLGHVGRSQSGQTRGKRCTPSGNRPPCSSAFGQGSPPTPGRPRKGFGMDGEGDSHGQCSPFEPWSAEFECSPISRQTIDKPWRRRERSDATPLICF